MDKLRVGIIGYGQIGPVHMRSYHQLPEKAEVVCVVDLIEEKAMAAKEEYGVPRILTDYEELIAADDIDIIDVCIPTYEHHDAVIKAARAGKHVFCEKPMAMTLEDAVEMETVCQEAGVKLQLGFVRRFDNQWLKFKDIVTSGELGRPVVWRSVAAGAGAPTPWFFKRELGGGPFMDGAVHNYDFGNFMFGRAKQVTARGIALQPGRDVMDTGVAVVEYESGDILQMMWSWGLKKGCTAGGTHDVLGEEGALLFRAPGKESLSTEDEKYGHLTINRPGGVEEDRPYLRNDMFKDEMEGFLDCILEDREPVATAKHGQEALKVALAVLESAETGETVRL